MEGHKDQQSPPFKSSGAEAAVEGYPKGHHSREVVGQGKATGYTREREVVLTRQMESAEMALASSS